ncbi:MAG: universal stress protein [Desulfobacterales bacterium]|jgi:nucleotide-binding universal stress UspA family protein
MLKVTYERKANWLYKSKIFFLKRISLKRQKFEPAQNELLIFIQNRLFENRNLGMTGGHMYKKILVPLDGSQRAEEILDPVENLARAYGAKVFLLRVEEEPLMLGYDEVIDKSKLHQQNQRRKQMESYLNGIEARFQEKGIETKHYIAYGPVVGTLLIIAKKEDVDLIALESHGLDGSYQNMFRSVAARLLQRSNHTVMVIRNNNRDVI